MRSEEFEASSYKLQPRPECIGCPRLEKIDGVLLTLFEMRQLIGRAGLGGAENIRLFIEEDALERGNDQVIENLARTSDENLMEHVASRLDSLDSERDFWHEAATKLQTDCPGARRLPAVSKMLGENVVDCASPADPQKLAGS